ncbi:MAG: hypothetical protein M3Y56_10085 [Armatimonadota bacterium]|nr:hypothetical protein [Armatimonadota bacterium]
MESTGRTRFLQHLEAFFIERRKTKQKISKAAVIFVNILMVLVLPLIIMMLYLVVLSCQLHLWAAASVQLATSLILLTSVAFHCYFNIDYFKEFAKD